MELRQLRYFVTVAEELHFGRAAERLHIVQPAVSQQVSRLERELGVRLLDRSRRHVRLTEAGERLLAEARATLAAADRVTAVAADLAATPTRVLRIGLSPGLGPRLERGLELLQKAVPALDIELELVSLPVAEQAAAVSRGEIEVALMRAAPEGPGREVIELWSDPVVVALPATHPLAQEPTVRLRDLAGLPLRLPSLGCDPSLHGLVVTACRREGFEPRLGRSTGATTDTLIEIASGPPTWAALYADREVLASTSKVALLLTEPPLWSPGCLVVSSVRPPACVDGLRAAFA